MKVGIVSDGKFGERAFEEIGKVFPTDWILVPFPGSPVVDDLELVVPDCDLYISYARHPDVALALIEKGKPVILGINPGPGFVRQAKEINEDVVAPVTMCSLEDTCWNEDINAFAHRFGVPIFEVRREGDRIESIRVSRGVSVRLDMGSRGRARRESGVTRGDPALRAPDLPPLPCTAVRADV